MSAKIVNLFRVAGSGKPNIQFTRELDSGTSLTDLFQVISLAVRLEDGRKLADRDWIIDDNDGGVFHFEFSDGEVPAGNHRAELNQVDAQPPNKLDAIPREHSLILVVRETV